MSKKDEDYLDDPEIVDFNEELDARAARSMEEDEDAWMMCKVFGLCAVGLATAAAASSYIKGGNNKKTKRRRGAYKKKRPTRRR